MKRRAGQGSEVKHKATKNRSALGWLRLMRKVVAIISLVGAMVVALSAGALLGVVTAGPARAEQTQTQTQTQEADQPKAPQAKKKVFGFLEKWVGNVPEAVEKNDPAGMKALPAIWEEPRFRQELLKTLGADRLKLVETAWGGKAHYMSLVDKVGDHVLAFHLCVAANGVCGTDSVAVLVDLTQGHAEACWEDKDGDVWLSSIAPPEVKPKGFCYVESPENMSRGH